MASSVREATIDLLVGICIGLAILFGFGATTMVLDAFFPRGEHAYHAASDPPKRIIGRMSYGARLKQGSDTLLRAHKTTIAAGI
jgi:hypothetical protein